MGLGLLGYCGFVMADAWWFQRQVQVAFEQELAVVEAPATLAPVVAEPIWGRLAVKRLGHSVMILEGAGAKTLRRGAGHIPGTGVPGEPGNIGISGHRDTFFSPLRDIRPENLVTITSRSGEFRYRVVSVSVVKPDDIGVLDAGETQVLTLVTCHPFSFIGSAQERYIVRAERVI